VDLLDWAQAAAELVAAGHAAPLTEVARRTERALAAAGRLDFSPTAPLVGALEAFADDLATVRIASLVTGYAQEPRDKPKAIGSAARL
jgi:CRISPR-associated protein Csx16